MEDFESLEVDPFAVPSCGTAGISSSTVSCFGGASSVIPGFSFDAQGDGAMDTVAMGAGFNANPSIAISTNTFIDIAVLSFTGGAEAVGFDLMTTFLDDPDVVISIFDMSDALLGTTTAPGSTIGTFFGVSSTMGLISRISLESLTEQAEGIDNLAFGGGSTTGTGGGASAVPLPASIGLLTLGLVALRLGRERPKSALRGQ